MDDSAYNMLFALQEFFKTLGDCYRSGRRMLYILCRLILLMFLQF